MKKGKFRPHLQPTVRILLVAPHLYQISLFNIKGYLKNLLLDRCKKVGAQYRHFQHSYFVDSTKLLQLKNLLQQLLHLPNPDPQIKFKIEDFPMTNIKIIMTNHKLTQSKGISKNRLIFVDRFSQNRYFYAKKKLQSILSTPIKEQASKQPKNIIILTSEINKKLWTSAILKNHQKTEVKQQMSISKPNHQLIELTFSELTNKKQENHQLARFLKSDHFNEPNKVYLITYDNLKFVQGSWFQKEVRKGDIFFTDDAEFLISIESELATLESKKRNFEAYKNLLQNYGLEKELIVFFSKVPEPCDMHILLMLAKPKNFTGIKAPISFDEYFNEKKLKSEEKKIVEDFSLWFKKRYRVENRCFKEIYYLLNNVILKPLDQTVFKRTPDTLPSLQLSLIVTENYQVHLIQSSSELIEKFKTMDKKYKKQCPSVNLRNILQEVHDKQKSQLKKFQITTKLDDQLTNKNSKNYFFQARELMINSKMDALLRRLFFVVNVQKERVAIIVEDEKLQKKIKKYFKETQIEYVHYSLTRQMDLSRECELSLPLKSTSKSQFFSQFDSKPEIPVCIININQVFKKYCSLMKQKKKMAEKQYEINLYAEDWSGYSEDKIQFPRITTAGSIHFIDSFWYEFNFEKEFLLSQIFNFKLSFIEEVKQENTSSFKEVLRKPQLPSIYYLFDGSHEKVMLEKYLVRKEELQSFKQQPLQSEVLPLQKFVIQMISTQKLKFDNLKCQVIDFLDIDQEFDKIEEEAKRLNSLKGPQVLEEKVFLPKFTKPQNKSFKQIIEERLNLKNIGQILDESDDDLKQKPKTLLQPQTDNQTQEKYQENHQVINYTNKVLALEQQSSLQRTDQKQGDSLFDFSLPICPQIMPETIRLESKHFQQNSQNSLPEIYQSYSQNQPSKDLFDQLLAPKLNSDNPSLKNFLNLKQFQSSEEVQTQTECDDNQNYNRLKKVSQCQPKLQPKFDDSLLFQNFGSLIYHQKSNSPKENPQINIKTQSQPQPQPLQILNHFPKKTKERSDSIEIITPHQVIDVEKMSQIECKNKFGLSKKRKNLRQTIQQKTISAQFYQAPKGKRLSGKKFYEEAISKSKQLWEKKLRKQKETIILAPKKLELKLVPKPNWRQFLTEEEVIKLRQKGISL